MKNLVRFAVALNWGVILFTVYFLVTEKFIWAVLPALFCAFHLYIIGHCNFSNDALSYYLRRKARDAKHKFRKSRKKSESSRHGNE